MAIQYGSIVRATMIERDGSRKSRRAVVVTPNSEITAGKPLLLVAISTKFTRPLPPEQTEVPSHPTGRCRTTLTEECVAVCDWREFHAAGDVDPVGSMLGKKMLEIADILTRIATAPFTESRPA